MIGIFLGLLMRKYDKVSARLSSSPKYCRAVAKNSIKPLVFMYHEAMSIFLGSRDVLNLVYFRFFKKYAVFDPLRHIPIEVTPPPGDLKWYTKNYPWYQCLNTSATKNIS